MNIRNFQVRKYSFYRDGQWQHFPPRNDISLTVINRATVKVIWKSSVMEELQVHINDVEAYSRSPAIGFKYYALGDMVHKRFQVSFTSPQEYQQCLSYLRNECDLNVPESASSSTTVLPSQPYHNIAPQITNYPDSQFVVPMQTYQPQASQVLTSMAMTPHHQTQQEAHQRTYTRTPIHSFFPSQPTHSQPTPSQSHIALPQLSIAQYTQPDTHIDYLSQILDPQKDDVLPSNEMSLDQLDKMTDEELQALLKDKIKDVGFINFVERLESCLKGMK